MEPPFRYASQNRSPFVPPDETDRDNTGHGALAYWLSFEAAWGMYRMNLYSIVIEHDEGFWSLYKPFHFFGEIGYQIDFFIMNHYGDLIGEGLKPILKSNI